MVKARYNYENSFECSEEIKEAPCILLEENASQK